jgi:subtilisin family serine protease
MDRFIVLRNLSAASTAAPFDTWSGLGTRHAEVAEPSLSLETLSKQDMREIARDPTVAAVAREMATGLIAPVLAPATATAPAVTSETWGVSAVGAGASSCDGAGVTVAVLDTGIDGSHEAFAGISLQERDFTGTGGGDANGHGTHCAGTICGRDVAGERIGVARGVTRLLVGKVLDGGGSGTSAMIFDAIDWAAREGADVISMSLGFDFPGTVSRRVAAGWPVELATSAALEAYRANLGMFNALMQMIRARAAFGQGCLVIAAAGNESQRDIDPRFEIAASLPAAAEGVISVGALDRGAAGLRVASFSNTFPQLAGPGVAIRSARTGGGIVALSGTSMACPHVVGVASLWWQALRRQGAVPATSAGVFARLMANARTDLLDPQDDPIDRGAGLVAAPA